MDCVEEESRGRGGRDQRERLYIRAENWHPAKGGEEGELELEARERERERERERQRERDRERERERES